MYILYPKWLKFTPDPERHTVAVVERHREPTSLLGVIDAVIDEDRDRALKRLILITRVYVNSYVDAKDGKVSTGDFTLVFCSGRIKWDDGTRSHGVADTPGPVVGDEKL